MKGCKKKKLNGKGKNRGKERYEEKKGREAKGSYELGKGEKKEERNMKGEREQEIM